MKKTLLLSVAASAMIMAGGDIAPATAAPATVSGWDFSGTAKIYYYTNNNSPYDLFDQQRAWGDAGIQLRATNSDVFAGIGAGFELSGVGTLDLEKSVVVGAIDTPDGALTGAWISQAYLTYAVNNTSFKAGRQTLPMGLSPFAYSESWNLWENSFDAVLVVNSDLPDTTAVLAWVKRLNYNGITMNDMNSFTALNGSDGVWMLTLQNKSIENVTLTGSYYNIDGNAIYWADAQIALGDYNIGLQGGQVDQDITGGADDLTAFGAKVSTAMNGFNLSLAYSNTDNGAMFQVGGMTSALYTNTVLDQVGSLYFEQDANKVVLSANTELLGGTVNAAYAATDSDSTGNTTEFDISYTTDITDSFNVAVCYANGSSDVRDDFDMVRFVGTYNF